MTWTPLPLGSALDVVATITKRRVVLALGPIAIRRLGWSPDEPNVSAALGDGENAGWLRITLDEEGVSAEPDQDGRLLLVLPRSTLPDLADGRGVPLTCRLLEGAVEVRLPTVGAATLRHTPRIVAENGRPVLPPVESIDVIGVPDLYAGLHANAWANGVELMFLSNGDVSVNGKVGSIDDVEALVQSTVERRNAARQRAS